MRGFRGVGCNLFFSDFCRDQASSTVQVKSIVQEPYLLLLAHYDSSLFFQILWMFPSNQGTFVLFRHLKSGSGDSVACERITFEIAA